MKLRLKHAAICVTTVLSIGPLAFAKAKRVTGNPELLSIAAPSGESAFLVTLTE